MLIPTRFPRAIAIGSALFALSISSPLFANEMPPEEMPESNEEMTPEAPSIPSDDDARQLLLDTAQRDDAQDLLDAKRVLEERQLALDDAIENGASDDTISRLEMKRDKALVAVDREKDESDAVTEAILSLTDQQVRALNRSLNDTRNNGRTPDLDADTLEEIAERDLGHREIQALTKALEEEAKAEQHAARFEKKFDETGRKHFIAQRDRALARGERQREKFEAKVDRFAGDSRPARDAVKDQARDNAKGVARDHARATAKQNAKDGAKSRAKDVARREARRAAREEARRAGQNNGRGRN